MVFLPQYSSHLEVTHINPDFPPRSVQEWRSKEVEQKKGVAGRSYGTQARNMQDGTSVVF